MEVLHKIGGQNPIQVTLSEFNNKTYLDIRKYYLPEGKDELAPTQKGIMMSKKQFEEIFTYLKDNYDAIVSKLS